ncbi:MAG TPA: hypothetical protein VE821_04655, partial [Pyrinomonadaceae bacterium]|nr:hypothetical protein [Pyrinomonadaceae bacterium]
MSRNLRHVLYQNFGARLRFACLAIGCLFVAGLAFIFSTRSQAATPSSGTLTTANTASNPLTYTAGPFNVANPSGLAALQCSPAQTFPCDDYALDVNLPDGLLDTKQIKVAVRWPSSTADFDVTAFFRNPDGTPGAAANSSGTSADPEIMILPAIPQKYLIRVVPFDPQGQSFTA